jgi:hypothetical protein
MVHLKGFFMAPSSTRRRRGLPLLAVLAIAVVGALAIAQIGVGATLTVAALAATAAMFVVLVNLTGF